MALGKTGHFLSCSPGIWFPPPAFCKWSTVMWTQLVSQGQDPYTMFMLHPLIKPLQREVFDCRRKKWLFDWFAVKCTHKQEILTDRFDDLPAETERKGHVSTIIYNTDVFVLSTNCWVAQWQGGQLCCFTARRSWVLIHQLAGGVACRGASKLLLLLFLIEVAIWAPLKILG